MKNHTVQTGEHLLKIAAAHGFSSIKPILDLPDNKDFKEKRKNPNVLAPGDIVVIPPVEPREEDAQTQTTNDFVLAIDTLLMRLRILNLSNKAVKRDLRFEDDQGERPVAVDGEIFETPISTDLREARAEFDDDLPADPPRRIRLLVGELPPHDTLNGVRERLNNLGYITGFKKEADPERLKWAVEEFQCDFNERKKKKILTINSDPADTKTQDALRDEHGV